MDYLTLALLISASVYTIFLVLTIKTVWRDAFPKRPVLIPVKQKRDRLNRRG